jgi:hypothetical protein
MAIRLIYGHYLCFDMPEILMDLILYSNLIRLPFPIHLILNLLLPLQFISLTHAVELSYPNFKAIHAVELSYPNFKAILAFFLSRGSKGTEISYRCGLQ